MAVAVAYTWSVYIQAIYNAKVRQESNIFQYEIWIYVQTRRTEMWQVKISMRVRLFQLVADSDTQEIYDVWV